MKKNIYINYQSVILIFALLIATFAFGQTGLTYERYDNITGTKVQALYNSAAYPDSPDVVSILNSFEVPSHIGSNYGVRVSGYITAPETGLYYFWIASDDEGTLELSTDDTVNNTILIAHVSDYASDLEWNKFPEQKSIAINLTAGQHYFVQAHLQEGSGGDHLTVGWRKPSDGNGTDPVEIIPGSVLSPRGTTFSSTGNWSNTGTDIYILSGNVGIGTQTTGTYKLAVNGNIRAKEIKVETANWPDYVFTENYTLPTLEEVQKHIDQNGHLINIPSAKEIETNGLELGEMNRLLLEKIEELTLYILEQEKRIQYLEHKK